MSFPWYCLLWILSCISWRTGTRAQQSLRRDMMEKTSTKCQRLRKNQRINLRWLYKSVSLDNLYKTIVVLLFEKLWVHITWIQNPQWNVIVLLFTNVESCYSCDTSNVIQNTGKFFLWNLKSLLMIGIQNPGTEFWNPWCKIKNPPHGIQHPKMSWITLLKTICEAYCSSFVNIWTLFGVILSVKPVKFFFIF